MAVAPPNFLNLKVLVSGPIGSGKTTFVNSFNPQVVDNEDAVRIELQSSEGLISFTCTEVRQLSVMLANGRIPDSVILLVDGSQKKNIKGLCREALLTWVVTRTGVLLSSTIKETR
ncbi:uncharacterized protein LOC113301976 [Papaver somniferum]|uniref:uncharacterized protein LOC113301976 n=1 Tax=Papaver somniferum TaxID=3469 RepID=UPI000E700B51|nr:uncharacterized protein LOC113301976 [Papaver somniferum]